MILPPPEIHVTDVLAYFNCRRAWAWQSRLRAGLEPMKPHRPFVMGTAYHHAMEQLYQPNGDAAGRALGAIAPVFEKALREYSATDGIVDDSTLEGLKADQELCEQMVLNYAAWARTVDDDWEVIDTERELRFPIATSEGGSRWWVCSENEDAVDFVLSMRIDGVTIHKPTSTLWLREYKTARSIPEEETKITKSLQHRVYAWGAEQTVHRPIAGVEYRFARKAAPQFPRKLNSGKVSVALTGEGEYTTPMTFRVAYEMYAGRKWPDDGQPPAEYVGHYAALVQREKEGQFFKVLPVQKTSVELTTAIDTVVAAAMEMLDEHTSIYPMPHPLGFNCNSCLFRAPCDRLDAGLDADFLLRNEYRPRRPSVRRETNEQ